MPDVVVVGGGHNGLTAAAYLARAGRSVLVLERRPLLGGVAAREELAPGFATPGLLHDTTHLRPDVVRELDLGRHGLAFVDEPAVLAPATDGPGLLVSSDPDRTREELARHSERDAAALADWRGRLADFRPFVERALNEPPPDLDAESAGGLWELLKSGIALRRLGDRDMVELLRVLPMCVADWLGEWFETEALRALLAAPAVEGTWTGPWSAGSAALLVFAECTRQRAVAGGPAAVCAALASAAGTAGAELRTDAAVARLSVRDGRVHGVGLASGEEIEAGLVLATCDPRRALLDLVQPRDLPPTLADRIATWRARGTTAKVNLALEGPLVFRGREGETVERARVPATIDDLERAFDAVKYGRCSERPVLDVWVPSHGDPSLAPAGKHVASILVHFAPHALEGGWTDAARDALGDAVLATLDPFVHDLPALVAAREVLSPADLEARYGLTGGHVHHGEHALDQLLHLRPTPECAFYRTPLDGLFLGGSGSHPGGGITCAPGRLAARAALA